MIAIFRDDKWSKGNCLFPSESVASSSEASLEVIILWFSCVEFS